MERLAVCPACGSEFVHPVDWAEGPCGSKRWWVRLRCPECESERCGVFGHALCEALDDELDEGCAILLSVLKRMVRTNMTDELVRFSDALNTGMLLPEDF